jgi:hypothetical protein
MMTSSRDGVIIGCAYLNGMNLFKNRALMGGSTRQKPTRLQEKVSEKWPFCCFTGGLFSPPLY